PPARSWHPGGDPAPFLDDGGALPCPDVERRRDRPRLRRRGKQRPSLSRPPDQRPSPTPASPMARQPGKTPGTVPQSLRRGLRPPPYPPGNRKQRGVDGPSQSRSFVGRLPDPTAHRPPER